MVDNSETVIDKNSTPFGMDLPEHLKGADMRINSISQRHFDFDDPSSLKVVQTYRRKYEALSDMFDENPRLLVLAHRDWARRRSFSNEGGRGTNGVVSSMYNQGNTILACPEETRNRWGQSRLTRLKHEIAREAAHVAFDGTDLGLHLDAV
jgi:hypothetical protein